MSLKRPLPASTPPPALPPALPLAPPAERVYPLAGPSKKPKKGEPGYGEPQEKRLRLFKKSCPLATQERADRVFLQRFFCVERNRTGEISEECKVLGSTGNCYTVKIQHEPTCDCPDGAKGNKCKHQLFVLLKILQVPQSSNLWYQAALLTPELRAIFANARPAPRTQLEERIANVYKVATGKVKAEELGEGAVGGVRKRVPQEGDSCPICYEDFEPNSETGLVFCLSPSGCGNALHAECFRNWAMTSKPTTCPLCREEWKGPDPAANAGAGPSFSREGYQNFAAQAGLSATRDTSTYYNGPRRRADGGWGRYDSDYYDGAPDADYGHNSYKRWRRW
ncbi:hypothetical protein RTBOTA2_004021 [Rhodotorula toruloides]|uniref:Uncharacterized protein n=1 Tax=Rhodotorula toruloides TaxID=5286 RepID=A0A2S9ZZZ1_RHOTO|nr:hypothetical protein RTBOTA2_004021 [Rhodotorula toruloides]PRQ71327.1 hypothetical protein AAT19DRAFT_10185 [Rhodotorula toruloides]